LATRRWLPHIPQPELKQSWLPAGRLTLARKSHTLAPSFNLAGGLIEPCKGSEVLLLPCTQIIDGDRDALAALLFTADATSSRHCVASAHAKRAHYFSWDRRGGRSRRATCHPVLTKAKNSEAPSGDSDLCSPLYMLRHLDMTQNT